MLGVVALMVAFINAFFLKEPTGSHEEEHSEATHPELKPRALKKD
jgi:hypothetical protein